MRSKGRPSLQGVHVRLALSALGGLALTVLHGSSRVDVRPSGLQFEFREGTELEAAPSPDGSLLALQLWRQIWVLDSRGGEARRVTDATRPPAEHISPAWSSDGRSILFSMMFADRDKGTNPHVAPVGGGEAVALSPQFAGAVAWSPDGSRFLCVREGRLWSVSTRDGATTPLTPDGLDAKDPSWSPDGRWVVFSSGGPWWSGASLYVVSAAGDSLRQLTKGSDYVPAWSGDSRQVFFVSERSGLPQIWWILLEGGDPRQLTNEPEVYPFPPRWLPGRNVLVYTAAGKIRTIDPSTGARDVVPFTARFTITRESYQRRRPPLPAPGEEIQVRGIYRPAISPNGRSIVFAAMGDLWLRPAHGRIDQLTGGPEYDGDAAWSPDGLRLAFVSDRGGAHDLWVMNLADRKRVKVTSTGGVQAPIWNPSGDSIVYRHAFSAIRKISASGGEPSLVVQTRGFGAQPVGWLDDRQSLLYWHSFQEQGAIRATTAIRSIGPTGDIATIVMSDPRAKIQFATVSPASTTLAYVTNGELWIRALSPQSGAAAEPRRLVEGPTFFPSWSGEGRIVYVTGERLMQVDVRTGQRRRLPLTLSYRASAAPSIVLRNARILAPEPREGHWDLRLEGGRIRAIRPSAQNALRAGRVIDLAGRAVLPGLFDVHIHRAWYGAPTPDLAGLLYRGITSVGDAGTESYWLLQQHEAIESGRAEGPRIFSAGAMVMGTAPNLLPHALQVGASEQLDRYLEHLQALGVAHVKFYNPWDAWVESAVVHAAHRRGLPVISHFLRPSSVAAGLDRKVHVELETRGWLDTRYRQDVLEILTKAGVALDVTAQSFAYGNTSRGLAQERALLADTAIASFMPASSREAWRLDLERRQPRPDADRQFGAYLHNIAAAHRAGVKIAVGTDVNVFTQEIMENLVEAGLTPLDALRAATRNAAEALGVEDRLGSVREGAVADLVVVEGDPLADITHAKRIWGVIKDGRWIDRGDLLARARARFGHEP